MKILLFGSTGSIGRTSLEVIKRDRDLKVLGLCTYRNTNLLLKQIKEFMPKYICVIDKKEGLDFKKYIPKNCKFFYGESGLEEFCTLKSDISIMGISGISCLKPLIKNIPYTRRVALANKESIVIAGDFVFKEALKYNTEIIPVDSEINALFQLLKKFNCNDFNRIYITASGGALFDYKISDLKNVTLKKVLSHPTWNMGKRITIDSSTLVNKAFEVIEAHYYFNIPFEKIDIVIHRESKIHALLELKDNTIFACVYDNNMSIPIGFSIYYPKLFLSKNRIDFKNKFYFSFQPLDRKTFPLFYLILDAKKRDDNSLVLLNAWDEIAIDYFLNKKINFLGIHRALNYIFKNYPKGKIEKLEDIFYWDNWARVKAKEYLERLC